MIQLQLTTIARKIKGQIDYCLSMLFLVKIEATEYVFVLKYSP